MAYFYHDYLDHLDKSKINKYCKNCHENKDALCELMGDRCGAITRFCECDVLQEVF